MKKTTFLILTLFFILVVFAMNEDDGKQQGGKNRDDDEFKRPSKSKYCERENKVEVGKNGYEVEIKSKSKCEKRQRKEFKRSREIQFKFRSKPLPIFKFEAEREIEGKKGEYERKVKMMLVFDRIIEYNEKNGKTGYQPNEDEIVKTYLLREGKGMNRNQNKWSKIQKTVTTIGESKLLQLKMNLKKSTGYIADLEFGLQVTPSEVSQKVNGTKKRFVLTPNSFKLSFKAMNIEYSSKNSSGLSLGAILMIKGKEKKKKENEETDEERPNDNTGDNAVVQVVGGNQTTDGFFSWKKFVRGIKQGKNTMENIAITASPFYKANKTDGIKRDDDHFQLKRIFFTPEGRPQNIDWDPSLGVTETPSSAIKISISMIFVYISLIFIM